MLDLRNLTDKEMNKYEIYNEEDVIYHLDDAEEFQIRIGSNWWVVGIDEENDIIYAQNEKINGDAIDDLTRCNYVLIGTQKEFIPGMISTRDKDNPIDDVIDFIELDQVYKLKYIGMGSDIYNKLDGYLNDNWDICYKKIE